MINFGFLFVTVRNTAPNQSFFTKSPSPSVPSPIGGGGSGGGAGLPTTQMVPSPLVPSPQVTNIMSQRTGMLFVFKITSIHIHS